MGARGFGTPALCRAGVRTGPGTNMGLPGEPGGTRLSKEGGTRPRPDTEQVKLPVLGGGGTAPASRAWSSARTSNETRSLLFTFPLQDSVLKKKNHFFLSIILAHGQPPDFRAVRILLLKDKLRHFKLKKKTLFEQKSMPMEQHPT